MMSEATLEYRRLLERFGRRPFLGFRFRYHAELRQADLRLRRVQRDGRIRDRPSPRGFFDAFDPDRVRIGPSSADPASPAPSPNPPAGAIRVRPERAELLSLPRA